MKVKTSEVNEHNTHHVNKQHKVVKTPATLESASIHVPCFVVI